MTDDIAPEALSDSNDEDVFDDLPLTLPLSAQLEAILFATPTALRPKDILGLIGEERLSASELDSLLADLRTFYESRGFILGGTPESGYRFVTTSGAAPLMDRMFGAKPRPLSRAAQETLAIIAYRQPVTRADIEFIRGVDAGSIIKNLLEKDLIRCVGRREDAGRPMLFGTSDEFLKIYGLATLKDLPPLESFQPSPQVIGKALERIINESTPSDGPLPEIIL